METDLTKISIEDLIFTPPTKRCLKAVDIRSVGQLMEYNRFELFQLLAIKSEYAIEMINDIRETLGGQGLHLKDDGLALSKLAEEENKMSDDTKTPGLYVSGMRDKMNDLEEKNKELTQRLRESEASYKAYQKFTQPIVSSSEIIPLPRAETFLEVGKSYIFGLGKIVYYGKIKAINDNEIWITDVSVTILDEDYCGVTSSGMDIKEEIILLRNTLHRIAIKK